MESPLSFCRGDEATTTWGVDPWQHDAAPMRSPNQGEELRGDSLGFSPDCMSRFVKAEFGVGFIAGNVFEIMSQCLAKGCW